MIHRNYDELKWYIISFLLRHMVVLSIRVLSLSLVAVAYNCLECNCPPPLPRFSSSSPLKYDKYKYDLYSIAQ